MANEKDYPYECGECGLHYKDEKTAKECEDWCRRTKTCNIETIKHAWENQQK